MKEPTASHELACADAGERSGISIDRADWGVRIVVPPVSDLRHLSRGYWIAGSIFAALTALAAIEDLSQGWPVVAQYAFVFLIIGAFAWKRLHERTIVVVRNGRLTITRALGRGRGRSVSWNRDAIAEVKYNPASGKLLVRIVGEEFLEYRISDRAEVTTLVAETISAALGENCTGEETSADQEDALAAGKRVQRRRVLGIRLAVALVLVAIAVMVAIPPLLALWMYMLIPAAIVAGITLGTQDKKFWL